MFGKKKHETEQEIKTILEETKRGQEELQKAQKEQSEILNGLKMMFDDKFKQIDILFEDNSKQLKRHSESIEDMLDEGKAQEALSIQYERQIKEDTEREKALLSLVSHYQEILSVIEEKIGDINSQVGDGWAEQMALFRKTLSTEFKQCAIEETGFSGETADYKYHEILNVIDTEEDKLHNTIAHTYSPGLIYHGKVVKKAQISVYRGRRNTDGNDNRN